MEAFELAVEDFEWNAASASPDVIELKS